MFNDLTGYAQFERELAQFLAEIRAFETEQFDAWCQQIQAAIDDPADSIALETAGRLMKLDRERNLLNVNYSDRLVGLVREVGQLSSLGFAVPRRIQQCTRVAEQFYRFGNVLKQVAHFYNSIAEQMLPCQQAMLLDEAVRLDRLLLPPGAEAGAVTWAEPAKLQQYVEQLQRAALALTNHNRQLRKAHVEVCARVLQLLRADFLADPELWASALAEVRRKFAEEERGVASADNLRPWAIHWDKQLYKLVQLHFQVGTGST